MIFYIEGFRDCVSAISLDASKFSDYDVVYYTTDKYLDCEDSECFEDEHIYSGNIDRELYIEEEWDAVLNEWADSMNQEIDWEGLLESDLEGSEYIDTYKEGALVSSTKPTLDEIKAYIVNNGYISEKIITSDNLWDDYRSGKISKEQFISML